MKSSKKLILGGTSTILSLGLILPATASPAFAAPSSNDETSVSKSYKGENEKRGYNGHNRAGSYNYKSPSGYKMPELEKCIGAIQKDAKDNEDVEGLVSEDPDTKVTNASSSKSSDSDETSETTTSAKKTSDKKKTSKDKTKSKSADKSKASSKSSSSKDSDDSTKPSATKSKEKTADELDRENGIVENNAAIIANSEQADNLRSVVDEFTNPRYVSEIIGGGKGVSSSKKMEIEDTEFRTSQVLLAILTKDPQRRQQILSELPGNLVKDVTTLLTTVSIGDITKMVTYFARTGMDAAKLAAAIAKIQNGAAQVTPEMTKEVLNLTSDSLNSSAQSVYMLNKFFKVWNSLTVVPSLKDIYRILDPSTDAGAMFYCSIPKDLAKSQTFVKSLASLGEVARVGAMTDASNIAGYLSDLANLVENLKVDLGLDEEARGSSLDIGELIKTGTSLAGAGTSLGEAAGIAEKAADTTEKATSTAEKATDAAGKAGDAAGSLGSLGNLGGGSLNPTDLIGQNANLADATEDTLWIVLNAFDAVNVVYSLILPVADASINAFVNIALLNFPGNNDLPFIGKAINSASPHFDKALEPIVKQLGLTTAAEKREELASQEAYEDSVNASVTAQPTSSKASKAKSSKSKKATSKKTSKKVAATKAKGSSKAVTDKSAVKSISGIAARSAKIAEKQGELSGDDKLLELSDQFKEYRKAVKKGDSTAKVFES